ncbi:MAG: 2-oxoacid:acceptor oxidoreductase subunit alpha [Candidatus Nanopelagicales bacterium]
MAASHRHSEVDVSKQVVTLDQVIIRFAGDSGDGMQLTGDQFTAETAAYGNDLSTMPDYPAEIRAPQGTLHGVSSFQLHFADHEVLTPGDSPNVLVAMNPAALKANIGLMAPGALLILNSDEFTKRNLEKVGYWANPLEDGSLSKFDVHAIALTSQTVDALKEFELTRKEAERSKNMYALGLLSWLYSRPTDSARQFLQKKFAKKPEVLAANLAALEAGWSFGETTEIFSVHYEIKPSSPKPGTYRYITGNIATAYGLIAASVKSGLPLFLGSYPITPATDILHELAKHKNFGVRTFQAEDEIAGIGSAIGAAYGGMLAVTTTSGPGIALKSEAIGLAVALELPVIIIDVQRGGPSTGLPTKTEQADLLQVMFGRNGESPVPIVAAQSPADCFNAAVEAARIAVKYRTPVFLLTDGALANGAEPWLLPKLEELPGIDPDFLLEPNHEIDGVQVLWPFKRDPETLARPWIRPGTPGLEHRIGGIEKADGTGNISYEANNHDLMVRLRAAKVAGIAREVPNMFIDDPTGDAELLVLGWGSTYGPIGAACEVLRKEGVKVAQGHLRLLNPFPADTEQVLKRYNQVLIPEMNLGQLSLLIRGKYLVDAMSLTKVAGQPFKSTEIIDAIKGVISNG